MATIHDVIGTGPIVATDEDTGLLLTANGAYFNLYRVNADGSFSDAIEVYAREKSLYETSAADLWDEAVALLAQIVREPADRDAIAAILDDEIMVIDRLPHHKDDDDLIEGIFDLLDGDEPDADNVEEALQRLGYVKVDRGAGLEYAPKEEAANV